MLTASPPRAVSLYLVFMSAPVSRMVLMTLSRLTWCVPSPRSAMRAAYGFPIKAAEAYRIGLAQWLVPPEQLMDQAMEAAVLLRHALDFRPSGAMGWEHHGCLDALMRVKAWGRLWVQDSLQAHRR